MKKTVFYLQRHIQQKYNHVFLVFRLSHLGLPLNKEKETVSEWPFRESSSVLSLAWFQVVDGNLDNPEKEFKDTENAHPGEEAEGAA